MGMYLDDFDLKVIPVIELGRYESRAFWKNKVAYCQLNDMNFKFCSSIPKCAREKWKGSGIKKKKKSIASSLLSGEIAHRENNTHFAFVTHLRLYREEIGTGVIPDDFDVVGSVDLKNRINFKYILNIILMKKKKIKITFFVHSCSKS